MLINVEASSQCNSVGKEIQLHFVIARMCTLPSYKTNHKIITYPSLTELTPVSPNDVSLVSAQCPDGRLQ